jgi:hypothetical protein
MQSERTKSAQTARQRQAVQVLDFISRYRIDARCPAVFAGDLNMGPPSSSGVFSVHYADRADAEMRCAAYQTMVTGCGFREVACEDVKYEHDICRFVTQGLKKDDCVLEYVEMCSAEGKRLSDTDAMCLSIKLRSLEAK